MGKFFNDNTGFSVDYSFEELSEEEFEELSKEHYLDETQAIYHGRHKKLSLQERINRYKESHKNPKPWKKLQRYYVKPHQHIPQEKKDELTSIIRTATDERPIHDFLEKDPFFLTRVISPAHHAQICIPKPNLGGILYPDFFIAGLDSAGFSWFGVELENPGYSMFTKKSEETAALKHAIRQIEDWRSWLNDNIGYAQNTLGYMHIDADLPCFLFIGRRKNEVLDEETLLRRRRAVKKRDKHGLFIHHYEWLLDATPTIVKVKD